MRVILIANTEVDYEALEAFYDPHYLPGYDMYGGVTSSDELAEAAGRLCYLSKERPNPDTATNAGYLNNIILQRHFSVLEHASATFYIDGVTRNFTHELIRHRHLSFSEVSQRYVNVEDFPLVLHPGLKDGLTDLEKTTLQLGVQAAKSTYSRIVNKLVGNGAKRKEARQAARHVLPGGLETRIVVSGNLRAWREMLEKRLSPAADAEFREVAQKILAELKVIAPATFQDFE